jgi:hypothetical protein
MSRDPDSMPEIASDMEEEPSCVDKDLQGVGYRMLVNQQPSAGR